MEPSVSAVEIWYSYRTPHATPTDCRAAIPGALLQSTSATSTSTGTSTKNRTALMRHTATNTGTNAACTVSRTRHAVTHM
eukprot:scaffold102483_cov28-Prasinocladus_malaysianus.AAC.1